MFDQLTARAHDSALRSIARVVAETTEPTGEKEAREGVVKQLQVGNVLVVTGAGVSTDSGIPDYRGPKGSLSQHRPMTYQEFRHDPAASHRYWARSFVGWRVMDQARPNRTHFAMVELEQHGFLSGVVTQNVDGLHAAAGTENLVTLHGDLARVVCLNCGFAEDRHLFDERLEAANPGYVESIRLEPGAVNPDGDVFLDEAQVCRFHMIGCLRCGSLMLKPDVVYFGEPVPRARKNALKTLLDASSSVLVAGSSLAVMSGYRVVIEAQRQRKPVSVINGGPGRADHRVDILWRTRVAPAFDSILDALDI
ncbi:NAD-dependent protein deacetylase 1 [Corynebacterium deserti GIMN1.010]|uniref:NAD-dependent protein deacetylase n=1 Tax=Corynebacterium deserti GIMN1.010 TaxID=931089 RepID=A0A0M5II28_9CORY|nr:Sir2 family NAD-dependent protein deacetylase [Corynebacterium deserti]ALC04561.1 NAD-dependent protein deacetylase 1 [Corynebacterium deserti GIMN1.010]